MRKGLSVIAVLALLVLLVTSLTAYGEEKGDMARGVRPPAASVVRTYFIAAEEVNWDFAPSGTNQITGQAFDDVANVFVQRGPDRIGKVYRKSIYREYTDNSFATPKSIPPEWEHKGILGPVIRAAVGDTIRVVFKNKTTFPASVHPHGVFYDKDSEGAPYSDETDGANKNDDSVSPGGMHTYTWLVPERAGPGPMDPSSIIWTYHSHVEETADTNSGLVGPMIITRAGMARPDGRPQDVDREFVELYTVFDENASLHLDSNILSFTEVRGGPNIERLKEDGDFQESNLMHSINGFLYGNGPTKTMRKGERVRFYMIGMGTEVDLHTPHWHGQTLLWAGMRTDMVELLPMSMKVLDMGPDNRGTWLEHCHVNDHLDAGMITRFQVER